MSVLGKRLKQAREESRYTQIVAAKKLGISNGTLSGYEREYRDPDTEILNKMADLYGVSVEWLMGRSDKQQSDWNSTLPELTAKDELDITADLEKMINNLDAKDGYAAFDGSTMDEAEVEDMEILKASLENSLRLAKRIAKQKFTPKKYRD
ncbi:helix-turn-helix domain-containing protein [Sporosarcina psychrophila]|uniref:Transcriptional regulator with XRE-family HTH domain n=1 Tax=Sporosarcina psychrophila TaxID=1476 RepID=A0ABV2K9Z5_SPOPS